MFFLSMDTLENFDSVLSTMVYKQYLPATNSSSTHYSAQAPTVHPWKVSSEHEFIKLIRIMAKDLLPLYHSFTDRRFPPKRKCVRPVL
ncbi:hypothetical protein REPUB_Repub20aG0001800 [Reevesia pubescens]